MRRILLLSLVALFPLLAPSSALASSPSLAPPLAMQLQTSPLSPSTNDLWIAVLAILTVLATSAISNLPAHVTALHKRLIAGGFAAAFATVGVYYQGLLDTSDWGRTWLVIFMAATTLYVVIAKPIAGALAR